MGIIWVREHWSGRTGPWHFDGVRSYTRIFKVLVDDWTDDPNVVLFATDQATGRKVSQLGDPYLTYSGFDDPGAICTSVRPTQDSENPCLWEVVAEFNSPDVASAGGRGADGGTGSGARGLAPHKIARDPFTHADPNQPGGRGSADEQNPFFQVPSVKWGHAKGQIFLAKDLAGEPVVNKAGTPLEGGMPVDVTWRTLSITRNEPTFDETESASYHDCINQDTFMGRDPFEVKCESIDGQLVQQAKLVFWQVSYEFTLVRLVGPEDQLKSWEYQPMNAGYLAKETFINKAGQPEIRLTPIKKNGHAVTTPWPLDENGAELDDDDTNYIYLKFRRYRHKSFGPLRLPFPWL